MSEARGRARLKDLLAACVQAQVSDLHLVPDQPPLGRISGQLAPVPGQSVLSKAEMVGVTKALLEGYDIKRLTEIGDFDGALTAEGGRFRYNVFRRGGELCVSLRRLEDRFRSLGELGMPESLYSLCDLPDGLVVVAGPTGAGKSTTLAALLDRINQSSACHIITIEDPVEYVHRPARSLVNQRQIGRDCSSFNEALVASLRQDPDVILVGEIRELHTIRTAITASRTSASSFFRIAGGVPRGASRPVPPPTSKPGTPDSATVGISGAAGRRALEVTAIARSLPLFKNGRISGAFWNDNSNCPATSSVVICALDL